MSLKSTSKPIIHIATDEKFIDAAYDTYEKAFPKKNRFLILLNDQSSKIQYVSEKKPYKFIYLSDDFVNQVVQQTNEASVVVFHSLTFAMANILFAISRDIKKVWSVYGHEIYENPYAFRCELYGEKTYKEYIYSFKKNIKYWLRPYYYRFLKRGIDPYKLILEAIKQVDFVGILYKEEVKLYEERSFLKEGTAQLKWTYYPLGIVINEGQEIVTSDNILLGNSASYTNNHLDIFDLLKEKTIGDRKVIVPLSYGKEDYANDIIRVGKKVFGKNFSPLIDFLPLSEYQEIIQSCGVVVMNHYRQQAVGNVLTALYMGAKVYLSKRSTLYQYLKRIECNIYCIEEDLKPNNKGALSLLDEEQMEKNRAILKLELSIERICEELQRNINPFLN